MPGDGVALHMAHAVLVLNLTLAGPVANPHRKRTKNVAEWTPRLNACWFVAWTLDVRRKYGPTIDAREVAAARRSSTTEHMDSTATTGDRQRDELAARAHSACCQCQNTSVGIETDEYQVREHRPQSPAAAIDSATPVGGPVARVVWCGNARHNFWSETQTGTLRGEQPRCDLLVDHRLERVPQPPLSHQPRVADLVYGRLLDGAVYARSRPRAGRPRHQAS